MEFKVCSKCKKEFYEIEKCFSKSSKNKDGFHLWCKMCDKKYKKERYKNNRGCILEQKKKYYEKKRSEILDRQNKYRQSERGRKARKKYCESKEGREAIKRGNKRYRQTEKGIKMVRSVSKRYYENNKPSRNMSIMMRRSLKGNKNGCHWEDLVDYTLEELKVHIENLFQSGMSWDNYGKYGWHIDHKYPISLFNIESYNCEDFKECWSLENLQPLWAMDNWIKGAKVNYNGK